MPINPSSIGFPTFGATRGDYRQDRIPRSLPEDKSEQHPGRLCWGNTGELPQPKPVAGVGFNVVFPEEHIEHSRQTTDVRIENPEDRSQYVIAKRTEEMIFNRITTGDAKGNNNTDTGGEDFGDFAPSPVEFSSFAPLGTRSAMGKLKVTFNNKDQSI
jgi:hypothetical protein